MAFCSKCGTKLTEGAKFCPKCGESVQSTEEKPKSVVDAFKEGWREGEKGSHNEPSSKESLSTWEKIALGVAGFVAFTGICGGIGDGMWIAVLISLCAMGAICAVFMGTIDKKYAWTTAIASFFIVCMTVAATTDDKEEIQNQAQTEQKTETPAEKKAREQKEQADKQESEKQKKINKVAKMAYQKGYDVRKETWGQSISPESSARLEYTFRYGKEPEDAGQNERWNVYLENFKKGFADAAHEIMKKMDSEDF